jgi:hypothetical protein
MFDIKIILSQQAEWAILYKEQKRRLKLEKGRAEKKRWREMKVKETINIEEN